MPRQRLVQPPFVRLEQFLHLHARNKPALIQILVLPCTSPVGSFSIYNLEKGKSHSTSILNTPPPSLANHSFTTNPKGSTGAAYKPIKLQVILVREKIKVYLSRRKSCVYLNLDAYMLIPKQNNLLLMFKEESLATVITFRN